MNKNRLAFREHIIGKALRLILLSAAALLANIAGLSAQTPEPLTRENLGPGVNSAYDEVLPIIAPDGETLYFVRKNHPQNIEDQLERNPASRFKDDIWYSKLQADGTWGRAVNIGSPLNTENHNYVCGVLPDNNVLLLGNYYFPDGTLQMGVSMSYRQRSGWAFPTNLTIQRFSNIKRFAEYTVSPHANVLIMSIEPDASYFSPSRGDRDLYVSKRMENGDWTPPENLGDLVNSAESDITPYLAPDGKTLYFSSNRPGGIGKNDIYMTRRLDDTWKNWSHPQNLGSPINSPKWDAYFTVSAGGDYGYFVSSTDTATTAEDPGYGRSDIFRIKLPPILSPTPSMLVFGKVTDTKGAVIPAIIRYERFSDGSPVGTAAVNPATGEYQIVLPAGDAYGFRAEAEGYYSVSENIDLTNLQQYKELEKNLTLAAIEKHVPIVLNNVFFDFNSATLREESQSELNRLLTLLKNNPTMKIEIGGHTDDVGSDEYNLNLSNARAQAVVDYLIQNGIAADRLVAKGYGKTQPAVPNDSEENRQINRRVAFTIL